MTPYGRQEMKGSDVSAVLEVLHSEFFYRRDLPFLDLRMLRCGSNYSVAVNSATSA